MDLVLRATLASTPVVRCMITGLVTKRRKAVIRQGVQGPAGQDQEIEAIIDTDFDGWLSLPFSIVEQLGLVWRNLTKLLTEGKL